MIRATICAYIYEEASPRHFWKNLQLFVCPQWFLVCPQWLLAVKLGYDAQEKVAFKDMADTAKK